MHIDDQTLMELNFVASFQELQADAAEINKQKGFSKEDALVDEFEEWAMSHLTPELTYFLPLIPAFKNARVGLKLALTAGELVGETLESVRKSIESDSHIPEFLAEEAELADAVIRLMNYATDRKLRLAEAIVAKNDYNRTRKDHAPEARAAQNGKKF